MSRAPHHEFAPPPTPGSVRALLLALIAHGLLLLALTSSIEWNQDVETTPVQAELWSALPVTAAAPAPELDPTPPPEPTPPATEEKAPPPAPVAPPQPSAAEEAAIAIAQRKEKEREALQKAQEQAQALAEQRKQEKLAQEKIAQETLAKEKKAQELATKEKAAKDKLAKDKLDKEQADKDKRAQAQAALDNKKLADKDKAAKNQSRQQELAAAKEAKMLDDLRLQNMKRIAGMAGAGGNGDPGSTSKDMEASGPSAGYAGRIVGRIKPNIVFTEDVRGNPRVEVEIRTSVSGAILSSRITQSSGVKSWDDAVLRAIEKTEVLPKDINGTIPTSMTLGFKPKE